MFNTTKILINTVEGNIDTQVADNFFSRLKGLLGTKHLPDGTGLLLKQCNTVHTIGMQYSIDIIFLSQFYEIMKIDTAVKPCRFTGCRSAAHTLELAAGQATAFSLQKRMVLLVDT